MKRSPLKRWIAVLGLIGMLPVGYLLVVGEITITEAASRAGLTLAAVMAVSFVARTGVRAMASSLERSVPQRRTSDPEPTDVTS